MTNIKIFSDFTCPFCYIGFSIANKLRLEEPDIDIQWIPFELNSEASLEGTDLSEQYPIEHLEMGYRRIERLGSEYGLKYNNKTKSFNTTRLHKAALYANAVGKYYEFAEEAFKTIFEYGKNVGDPAVVNDIGFAVQLNVAEMNQYIDEGEFDELMEEGRNLSSMFEIESVPTFVINDKKKVTTLKDYNRFKKDLLE